MERLKRIRNAIWNTLPFSYRFFKFQDTHSCKSTSDFHIDYPYTDPRICLKLSVRRPIPFESMKQFRKVREYLGEPLGFEYYIANWRVDKPKIYFDA